jgi:hypothetical protein
MNEIKTLAELVAKAESGDNPWAVRFEPLWRTQHYPLIVGANKCSAATALVLGACSWGFYQIMGDNLYGLGLSVPLGAYMADAALQAEFFQKFCTGRGIFISLETFIGNEALALNFCHHYNGDAEKYHAYLWSLLAADGWKKPGATPQTVT